jgi:malate synthase
VTEAGLRNNVSVAIQYLAAWLGGTGAVAIYNLMEDAATAEISRSQVWQWIRHGVRLADGPVVTRDLAAGVLQEELARLEQQVGAPAFAAGHYHAAAEVFREVALGPGFVEFLTLPAYARLDS